VTNLTGLSVHVPSAGLKLSLLFRIPFHVPTRIESTDFVAVDYCAGRFGDCSPCSKLGLYDLKCPLIEHSGPSGGHAPQLINSEKPIYDISAWRKISGQALNPPV